MEVEGLGGTDKGCEDEVVLEVLRWVEEKMGEGWAVMELVTRMVKKCLVVVMFAAGVMGSRVG